MIDMPRIIIGQKCTKEYLNLASVFTLEYSVHVQYILNESSAIEQSILHTRRHSMRLLHVKIYIH